MPPISSLGVRERNASSFEMCFSYEFKVCSSGKRGLYGKVCTIYHKSGAPRYELSDEAAMNIFVTYLK